MTHPQPKVGRWLIREVLFAAAALLRLAGTLLDRASMVSYDAAWRISAWRDRRFPL